MAQTKFYCQECQMDFDEYLDIKRHISAEHINYFPCKCFTCKARGIKHETVTAELMYEHTSTVHEGIIPDVRLLMTRENELAAAIEKCRRLKDVVRKVVITLGDTLADTGNGAIESEATSTEFEREDGSLEVLEITNNDSIGPTNAGLIYAIQPENVTTRADQMNFDANLQGLIHSLKTENIKAEDSSRKDEPNVNSQENTEVIDSHIPPVPTTEPTAIVETQENVTNPTTNSENTLASNAMTLAKVKPGSGTTAIVPGELRLEAALNSTSNKAQHSSVAITTSRTPRISLRKRRNVSSISVESPKRKFLSHVPIDVDANEAQHISAITTRRTSCISVRNSSPIPERRYPTRSARRSTIEASMEALNNDEDDERKQPLPEQQNVPPIPQNKRIPRAKSVVNEPHYNLRKGLIPQPQCAGNMSGPEEKKRRRAKTVVFRFANSANDTMAATHFNCYECQMGFNEYFDIKCHISAKHLKYFPYKCMTCMEIGVRYETISAELMYQHTSTVHLGIEPDVRFSTTEENELKIAIEKCRQSIAAEQVLENNSKDVVRKVFISLGTALDDSGTNDTGNGVLSAEDEVDIREVPEGSNRDHIETTIEGEVRRPDADVSIQQNSEVISEDVRPLMIREDELNTAIENNRNSIGDTLADNGKSATSTKVISTEIKQEGDNLEVHESTNNDNIGPTNGGLIYGIQPENVTTRGNEPNVNIDLHPRIKAESDSSRCDEPKLNVNGEENTETIDSQIPLVSSTEPTDVVETQENVTNPTTNSDNTSALNAKSESLEIDSQIPLVSSTEPTAVVITQRNVADPVACSDYTLALNARLPLKVESVENVSTVPIGLRLEAALSSFVPIDVEANEAQHNPVIAKGHTSRISLSSERRYPKKRRSSMEALNNDKPTTSVEPKRRGRKCLGEPNSDSNLQIKQLKRAKNPNRYAENVAECPRPAEVMARNRSLQKKPAAEPSTVGNSLPAQRSSEVNQSTAHNSNGDANENGLLQNPYFPIEPAQKMKITHIRINISNGKTSFQSTIFKQSFQRMSHSPRPLSEYVSLLRKSEPDQAGCVAHILYRCDDQMHSPQSARKKMEKLSQEILSIAHLWANGRVVADLFKYSENDNKVLSLPDFCNALFNQERSILKCKALVVTLHSCWPMSIVTNAARHCSKLILKETGYCDKQQHFRLLDDIYERKIPQQVAVTFELLITRNTNEFIDELTKHFQRSTELNFKLRLFTPLYCAPPHMLLRNEHGLTLTTKSLSQYSEQRDCVTIEQRTDS